MIDFSLQNIFSQRIISLNIKLIISLFFLIFPTILFVCCCFLFSLFLSPLIDSSASFIQLTHPIKFVVLGGAIMYPHFPTLYIKNNTSLDKEVSSKAIKHIVLLMQKQKQND